MKKTKTREALYSDFLYPKKCRRSQPSPVSPNAGCWTIHLASACNCSILTSSKFLFLTTSASWQKMFSDPEIELLSLEFLSAIFTLLNVHTRDDQGHMTKIEAFSRRLTKLQLGPFFRRKKAQRGIPSILYLFQCVI